MNRGTGTFSSKTPDPLKSTAAPGADPATPQAAEGEASPVQQVSQAATQATTQVVEGVKGSFNRAWYFLDGTIRGALNDCAKYGRYGVYAGIAAGVLMMLAPAAAITFAAQPISGLAIPIFMALAGGATGAAVGLIRGTLTGGAERLASEDRKIKYAQELDERRVARTYASNRRVNRRGYLAEREMIDNQNFDKFDQYFDRRSTLGGGTQWRDYVDSGRGAQGDLSR